MKGLSIHLFLILYLRQLDPYIAGEFHSRFPSDMVKRQYTKSFWSYDASGVRNVNGP